MSDRARGWFRKEMPCFRVAVAVRVGIAGEYVRREVAGKTPLMSAVVERQIDGGEIASMVAIPRVNRQ